MASGANSHSELGGSLRFFSHGKSASSSFEMAREEAGLSFSGNNNNNNQKVSNDLLRSLQDHAAADEKTLNLLWDLDIWTAADLANVDVERMVHVSVRVHLSLALTQ